MALNGLRDQAICIPTRRIPSSPRKLPPAKRMYTSTDSRLLRIIDAVETPETRNDLSGLNSTNGSEAAMLSWPPRRAKESNPNNFINSQSYALKEAPITRAINIALGYSHHTKSSSKAVSLGPKLPLYSYRKFTPTPRRVYVRNVETANELVSSLKSPLGFDMEWRVSYRKGTPAFKTAVVQMCDQATILVIQLSAMKSFPSVLKDVIESPDVLKLGANVLNDGNKLCRDYGIKARGLLELGTMALASDPEFHIKFPTRAGASCADKQPSTQPVELASVGHQDKDEGANSREKDTTASASPSSNTPTISSKQCIISLAGITAAYTGKHLDKGPARCSNWEKQPLTEEQLEYASNDVHCAVRAYHRLAELAEAAGRNVDPHTLTRSVYDRDVRTESHARTQPNDSDDTTTKVPSSVASSSPAPPQISRQSSSASSFSATVTSSVESVTASTTPSLQAATKAASKQQPAFQRPQHIRAYNLWHHKRMGLDEMRATLRLQKPGDRNSAEPLKKGTVITYIITALQVDSTLPFDHESLRKLVSSDSSSLTRHKEWLYSILTVTRSSSKSPKLTTRTESRPASPDPIIPVAESDIQVHGETEDTWSSGSEDVKTKTRQDGVIEILD